MQSYTIIAALLILLGTLIIGSLFAKLIKKLFKEFEIDRILKKQGIKLPVSDISATIGRYAIYILGIIWALEELNISSTVLYIILAVLLFAIVTFIIIAFKDLLQNLVAGLYIKQKNIIKEKDVIKLDMLTGIVKEITLTHTKLQVRDEVVIIPNMLITRTIIKKLKDKKWQRKS